MANVRFHHVQMFVSELQPLETYKKLEKNLNDLSNKGSFDPFSGGMRFLEPHALPARIEEGRQAWCNLVKDAKCPSKYSSFDQDVVEQMIVGLGWRVTAEYIGQSTRSLLVCSQDARGQKCVVTTKISDAGSDDEPYYHFKSSGFDTFKNSHIQRDGVAVLGFEVDNGSLDQVLTNYQTKHPKLLPINAINTYTDSRTISVNGRTKTINSGEFRTLDVYAYYTKEGEADKGTVIRLLERTGVYSSRPGFANPGAVLPGLEDVHADFDGTSVPAYSDHWVSNVFDRKVFLKTLEDTLGFTPKVDFNAGVVAAGEAIIESTVTGNTSTLNTTNLEVVLEDQSQVYLPINNALSTVGHVHGFLEEVGQGVQHLACRVKDLTAFIERVNNYRAITGQGFTFLRIPRSYYGKFGVASVVKQTEVSEEVAQKVHAALVDSKLMTPAGIVSLDITKEQATAAVKDLTGDKTDAVVEYILRARYNNLYTLLRDHIEENQYLQIVRNQVLVDIQGQDILYQIFTSNILQKKAGDEAPFFEFIQRVCSAHTAAGSKGAKIRPGCGGFGIRNFLTLFLSIEVSKAMLESETASDPKDVARAKKMVEAFTEQLDVSNPILTGISDAMTAEADHLEAAENATSETEKAEHLAKAAECNKEKLAGNEKLKETSDRYKEILKKLRSE
eukprot:TRINITY_DN1697_c0_g2_i1.p1 TRINITY_DN1697_c0_g2~~TRINITY_DN1697_c0_g2_i1.p1  ORF type:complete len:672 (+),score=168.16 TRINITY_DN1697_c0_g2_i1:69-2084(+)